MRKALAVLCAAVALTAVADAQWLNYLTPDIPRNADGTLNFNAPIPHTSDGKPDLSGLWRATGSLSSRVFGQGLANLANGAEIQMLPSAESAYKRNQDNGFTDMSSARCLPHGIPAAMLLPNLPFKIVQTPKLTLMLFEEFVDYRQIFTDGRQLPRDPNPSWYGYSVGHWDGDSLMVETIGFNDRTWLDLGGHTHSTAMRMTERFQREDFGHLKVDVIIDDPQTFSKPWKVSMPFMLFPDTELLEYVCENEKDREHIVRP